MTLNTQTQANNDNASYDARRFGCAPWGAARGIAFRRFKRAFIIYLASLEIKDPDDEFSYDDELLGKTEGGTEPHAPPPLFTATGNAATGGTAPARRRKQKRNKRVLNILLIHITDEALKTTIQTEIEPHELTHTTAAAAWAICVRDGHR